MQNNILMPDIMQDTAICQLFSALDGDHGKLRFVGGCVRDMLLGKIPRDIDMATSHRPEEIMKLLGQHNINYVPTGLKHGTITAIIHKKTFEITTLRQDINCDGRHADVEFTDDFAQDAARRDFTFNAMSCDLSGKIYDYFNGEDDLKNGVVKFVGDPFQRIEEDFLRILRFFRFYARYGKEPVDILAMQAIKYYVASLVTLSGERIQQEMFRLLHSVSNTDILEIMQNAGVLEHINLRCMNFESTNQLIMLNHTTNIHLLHLACLLRSNIDKEDCMLKLIKSWRLSNHDKKLLKKLVQYPDILEHNISIAKQKQFLRRLGKKDFLYIVSILLAESLAVNKQKEYNDFATMQDLAVQWDIPHFPVSGKDIIALGIEPGKNIGEILHRAENYWESEEYKISKKEIMFFIKSEQNM